MSTNDLQQKLRAGVDAAKRGDRTTARRLLEQVVTLDDRNEMAWMWLASVVNTTTERRQCLERVLAINPNNERAREALQRLAGGQPAAMSEQARVRQTINQIRRPQTRRADTTATPDEDNGLPFDTSTIIIGGLVLTVIIIIAAVVSILGGGNTDTNTPIEPTAPAVALITEEPTATETPLPLDTATPVTPVNLGEVTRNAPTLPPTFTATFTATATETATETPLPPSLESFELLYASLNPGSAQPDVYFLRGDATGESLYIEEARDIVFDWSGTRIAFIRDVVYSGEDGEFSAPEIFIANTSDPVGSARQVTQLRALDTAHPSWSPDGESIVFASTGTDTDSELWIINPQGENLRQLTDNEATDLEPSWSPVDNVILYTSDEGSPESFEIFAITLTVDGLDIVSVEEYTRANLSSYSPVWSHDGERIAFVSTRGGDGDIYIMDRNGQNELLVTFDDGGAEDRSPAFSPDGRWLFFISNRESENFQLYAVLLDGSNLYRVLENARDEQSVFFRPLGRN